MNTSGKVTSCCVVLVLVLTFVSAGHRKLKTLHGLKEVDFGESVPKHSLTLLHWFANTVNIDNNNRIWLTFDPDDGDYGSHHYGNYEELLDPAPEGYQYYTVGNLNQDMSVQFPDYVVEPPEDEYEEENRDRIIIRVRGQWIDQVYMTQHYDTSEHQGSSYDPAHTYRITVALLRQIREFSVREGQRPLLSLRQRYGGNIDDSQLMDIRNTWGHLACLGLLLLIVIEEKYSSNQRNRRRENNRPERHNRSVYKDAPAALFYCDTLDSNRPERHNRSVYKDTELTVYYGDTLDNNRAKKRCCVLTIASVIIVVAVILAIVLLRKL